MHGSYRTRIGVQDEVSYEEADMDREGQTITEGRALAEKLGRVGLWTRQLDVQPAQQVREAIAELEALGWGSLWFWEVFGREALTSAGLLLCASQRMVIASGIANIWARDPVAMTAAGRTLVEAYPGRFVLGIGVSHGPIVDARGHRYQRPLDKMRGYLDAMDAAPWQGPPLAEEPPLVLAALGPRMLELAAKRSAGALLYNGTPEATVTARSMLGPEPLLAVEQAVLLEEDPAEARGICREFMTLYLTLPNYTGAWDRVGLGPEEQVEGGSDRMVDAVVAWGGPEVIAERVRAHLDAGADHVCVQVLDPDPNGLPMTSWRALTPALLER
jgi:probable F420-dependent oxidoreductase